ncbi:MAG: acyl-CoA synthetase [Rhodoblastus sp.]|nr:acyl-CoA synthetase [Rhodoblastus sp.]
MTEGAGAQARGDSHSTSGGGRAIPIDRSVGAEHPRLGSAEDVAAFEKIPYAERIAAASTFDAIRLGASVDPNAPAIQFLPNASHEDEPVVITHGQFIARVTQTANALHELGVGPNDVVSFMLPLLPQAFFTLFGAEAAGIANPVNPLLEPHQIAEILEAANTKVLVTLGPVPGTDIWDKVMKIRGQLKNLKAIVVVAGPSDEANGIYAFDALVAKQPHDRLLSGRTIKAEDTAAYFHTGGTTGTPKLVRHTHGNQVYQAWVCNLILKTPPGSNLLFGMPLFHVGGSLTQALAMLAAGGCLVILSPAGWRNPSAVRNIWPLVQKYRPQVLSSVPTVLAATLAIPTDGFDLSSLRYSAGGGSAIPVAVGNALQQRHNTPVLEVYGMTETASVHTISFPDREIRLGSVGHPVPYSRVRIVRIDADGNYAGDCATNEIGVVAMAGPGVFSGYMMDEHNKGAFVEPGWVNSGDLGRLDDEGYLWITGRAKDLVIRGGHNIDPAPIEDVLFAHPSVAIAAVIGQPDAYAGELPLAYVQLNPGMSVQPGELEDWVRERTPERAAVPVAIISLETMPLTGVGKVFKPSLRWDAAQRVFTRILTPLKEKGVNYEVAVGAHGTHGSVATVTISGVPEAERGAVESYVHGALDPFVLRHEVKWG